MTILTLVLLVGGFAALAAYARHDRFAGPGNMHDDVDDLGASEHRLVRH